MPQGDGAIVCYLKNGADYKDYIFIGKEKRAKEYETISECNSALSRCLLGDE